LKERAIALLGGCCEICGYVKTPEALQFHHVCPMEKEFEISEKMSWEVIEVELDKCALLCANCHIEVHSGHHPEMLEETIDWG